MEKQKLSKQVFAGPYRDNGTQNGPRALGSVSPTKRSLYSLHISQVIALFQEVAL